MNGKTTIQKKTALVTGASSGMGKEIAKRLIMDGYRVFVAARQVDKPGIMRPSMLSRAGRIRCGSSSPHSASRSW